MTASDRRKVILEFEQFARTFGDLRKEVHFKDVMPTDRKFRADYLIVNIIIEVNGGQWSSGRHNRGGAGYENDLTKSNTAQVHGFRYLQFTYEMLRRLEYVAIIRALASQ